MESVTALRINYHLHKFLAVSSLVLIVAAVLITASEYNPHKFLSAAAFFASVWWGNRMDGYAVNFKHRYHDELNKLSYRVWGDH